MKPSPSRHRLVILCAVVLAAAAMLYGRSAPNVLTNDSGDFEHPGAESAAAEARLAEAAGANPEPDMIALVHEPVQLETAAAVLEADPDVGEVRPVAAGETYLLAHFRPGVPPG